VVNGRQYDVHRVTGLRSGTAVDVAVVLQDDNLSHLATRVVAPMIPTPDHFGIDHATPTAEIDGVRYMVAVHLVTTLSTRNLGQLMASLKPREREIKRAIDLIFFGV
jgi:hypothetical protein